MKLRYSATDDRKRELHASWSYTQLLEVLFHALAHLKQLTLPDDTALLKQNRKADQQVPVFRSDMSPSDLVSMIESYYRIRSRIEIFNVLSVEPTSFPGTTGIKADYDYVGADELPREGRVVMAIIESKLYLARLDGTATHYFSTAVREFDSIVASATLATR